MPIYKRIHSIFNGVMKKIILLVTILLLSSLASAQIPPATGLIAKKRFTGLSVGFNADLSSTTAKLEYLGARFEGLGRQNISGSIQADYGIPLGSKGILLMGIKRHLAAQELLNASALGSEIKVTRKNHNSVFLAPGLLVNDKTLAFTKISYERFDANIEMTANNPETRLVQGVSAGVGLRTYLTEQLLLNVEVSKVYYSKDSFGLSSSTGSTYGSVGMLHNFN